MQLKFVTCVTIQLAILSSTTLHVLRDKSQNNFPRITKDDYAEVLRLSFLFFEAQRSGKLPEDNRIPWRGDSALSDRGENGEDLTGGYYNDFDYVKFGFTTAFTTTMLAWGAITWPDAYNYAGQINQVQKAVKWATDYLIKCHVSKNVLYGQVGDVNPAKQNRGRPEEMRKFRPALKIDEEHPGSDLAGETAAALAAASILFRETNPKYSITCLQHAKELYHFATKYQGLYHVVIKRAEYYQENSRYGDELAWAAAWLFKATNIPSYLEAAKYHYEYFNLQDKPYKFSYDEKVAGVQVLLAQLTRHKNSKFINASMNFCEYIVHKQARTLKRLVVLDFWGTLSHAANVAFICLQAASFNASKTEEFYSFAKEQINYMINGERSFVVGYGRNWPTQPFHAASSCPYEPLPCDWLLHESNVSNSHILYGALVSGPDIYDTFYDNWDFPEFTKVALDYNAGFTGVIAGLLQNDLLRLSLGIIT